MAEAHVKELIEANPNPSLEEEAAAQDAVAPKEEAPAIPEKFMRDGEPDYEALAKAYSELEKKQSAGKKGNDEDTKAPEETDEEGGDAEDDGADSDATVDAAKAAVKKSGLDFDALSKEYWDSGELAESSYKALEKSGIPRNLVDAFIAGQEAIVESTRATVFNEAGGEENYNSMLTWAADNMNDAEIDAYNSAVNSGNMNQTLLAVKGLAARYKAAEGFEPKVNIGGSSSKEAGGYKSWKQVEAAMNDPRYGKDPAYVAEVEAKIARSGNLL